MKAMMSVAGAMTANLVSLGDELGFYQALKASGGPMTSTELAEATDTKERFTREWLYQQASHPAARLKPLPCVNAPTSLRPESCAPALTCTRWLSDQLATV